MEKPASNGKVDTESLGEWVEVLWAESAQMSPSQFSDLTLFWIMSSLSHKKPAAAVDYIVLSSTTSWSLYDTLSYKAVKKQYF